MAQAFEEEIVVRVNSDELQARVQEVIASNDLVLKGLEERKKLDETARRRQTTNLVLTSIMVALDLVILVILVLR